MKRTIAIILALVMCVGLLAGCGGSKSESSAKTYDLIIATGGKAGGQYGCQGDGYQFAKDLGHTMVKVRPALAAVNCRSDEAEGRAAWMKEWKGVRSQAKVSLWRVALKEEDADPKGICVSEDQGEVQFTDSCGGSVFSCNSGRAEQ